MNVAIVGTSRLNEYEEEEIKKLCLKILESYIPTKTTIISGGAKGVDTIASDLALCNGFAIKPILQMRISQRSCFFQKR